MRCGYPVEVYQSHARRLVPCGQCMNCRINKKRMVTGRILLEARYSRLSSSFVTLTYNPEHVPSGGALCRDHLRGFINRVRGRKAITAIKPFGTMRYFAVGEYGTESWRPHYHLAIFGVPADYAGVFESAWTDTDGEPFGFIHVGEITHDSAQYIAGYTTKKMTSDKDAELEARGLPPEFPVMSKFPPLGAMGMRRILDGLYTQAGAAAIADKGDVPIAFRLDGKTYPIGTYWRAWLREQLGIDNPPQYKPWEVDPDGFEIETKRAAASAAKSWKNRKRRVTEKTV